MPRRDRDPRPSIEVLGGAPTRESVQEVRTERLPVPDFARIDRVALIRP